jgi:hypothetical protein
VNVNVTGHLNILNKELQGRDKLITEMSDIIKAFKVTLRMWEDECTTLFIFRA